MFPVLSLVFNTQEWWACMWLYHGNQWPMGGQKYPALNICPVIFFHPQWANYWYMLCFFYTENTATSNQTPKTLGFNILPPGNVDLASLHCHAPRVDTSVCCFDYEQRTPPSSISHNSSYYTPFFIGGSFDIFICSLIIVAMLHLPVTSNPPSATFCLPPPYYIQFRLNASFVSLFFP